MTRIVLPDLHDETWDGANNYLSKSRLVLFKFCGIKYRKQYIDKCLPYEESHASTIGLRYHSFMELLMDVAEKYPTEQWYSFIHPDFTEEEVPFLKWSIDIEIERYKNDPEYFKPIGIEYRIVDHVNKIRGIIDRIDQLDDETINVIEYKTTVRIDKPKLQMEFGFYDMLLDSIPELKNYKRKYTIYYPRMEQIVVLNPSRRATIEKKIKAVYDAIESGEFKPNCGINLDTMRLEYSTNFCTLCSLEEIAQYNGLVNYKF